MTHGHPDRAVYDLSGSPQTNVDYAVMAEHLVLGVFELGYWMFGFDDYLYRLAEEPELVHAFSRRVLDYQKKMMEISTMVCSGGISTVQPQATTSARRPVPS